MQLFYKQNYINTRILKNLIFLILIILFLKTILVYEGNKIYYLIFSIIFNFSIYRILFKKFYFFEFFFSSLLWLGFWFKFTIFESGIYKSKEIFDGRVLCGLNIENFDNILLVSSIGYFGYILSLITVDNFNFLNKKKISFHKIRKKNFLFSILFIFLFLLISSTITNYIFGIYQKGISSNEDYLYLNKIVYPFFFNIGFGAALCYFIKNLHIYNFKYFYIIILIIIFEGFLTNVTMLSRNMILYSTSIFFGYVFFINNLGQLKFFKKKLIFSYLIMLFFFLISIISTNNLRDKNFIEINTTKIENKSFKCKLNFKIDNIQNIEFVNLLLSRSIGIEGMIATTNNKQILGFDFLKKTLDESPKNQVSLYEKNFLKNQDRTRLYKNSNQVILPGILGYLYFSGSKSFLFLCMYFIGLICLYFEKLVIKFTNNIVLSSFISFIIVWRLINFGYLVSNTLNFILSIMVTIIVIYFFQFYVTKNDIFKK